MSIISILPEEIQEKVILKTPVKSIFTCKCVCKLWCNLISSSTSIRDRLKLTSPNMNLSSFIVLDKSSLYHVEYDFENSDEQVCQSPKEELFDLGSLGYFDKENIIIVGSCNDLVCLTTKINDYLCGHAYVCNPITQECTQLPGLVPNNKDYKDARYGYNFYGFGYLHSTNEYKVVRISYKFDPNIGGIFRGKIHVNTLGDGRGWRYREDVITNQLCWTERQGIFVDEALYWKSSTGPDIAVIGLTEEKLYMLPPPPRCPSERGPFKMVVLGGQLCFFQATTYDSSNIWLLKKRKGTYDNCSSPFWIEGAFITMEWITSPVWIKGSSVTLEWIDRYRPLTITKNGDILLLYREKWDQPERSNAVIRYDPKTSTSKELGDIGFPLPGYGKSTIHFNSYIFLKSLGK